MSEFKKGQRVRVEFEGVIADHPIRVQGHDVAVKRDSGFAHSVRPEDITLLDPPDWPPQVGDIWEANGMEWFAKKVAPEIPGQQDECILMSPDDAGASWGIGLLKGLNPVLVRRRGQ